MRQMLNKHILKYSPKIRFTFRTDHYGINHQQQKHQYQHNNDKQLNFDKIGHTLTKNQTEAKYDENKCERF